MFNKSHVITPRQQHLLIFATLMLSFKVQNLHHSRSRNSGAKMQEAWANPFFVLCASFPDSGSPARWWNRLPRKVITAPRLPESKIAWTRLPGTWCDSWESCTGLGAGPDDPCGLLPAQDVLILGLCGSCRWDLSMIITCKVQMKMDFKRKSGKARLCTPLLISVEAQQL